MQCNPVTFCLWKLNRTDKTLVMTSRVAFESTPRCAAPALHSAVRRAGQYSDNTD